MECIDVASKGSTKADERPRDKTLFFQKLSLLPESNFINFIGLIFLFQNNQSNGYIFQKTNVLKHIHQISNPINKIIKYKQNKLCLFLIVVHFAKVILIINL